MTSSVGLTTSSLPTMSNSVAGSIWKSRPVTSAENRPSNSSCVCGLGRTGGAAATLVASSSNSDAQGVPGRPMTLDTDRISGFVRTLDGELTAAERRLVPALRQRHGRADLVPVRLFGRGFDAQLLGALSRAAGTDAGAGRAASFAARLRIEGTSVNAEAVRVAGRAVPLRISIPAPRGCRPGAT